MNYLQIAAMLKKQTQAVRRMVASLEAGHVDGNFLSRRDMVFNSADHYIVTPSGQKIFSSDAIEKIIRGFGLEPNDYIGKG